MKRIVPWAACVGLVRGAARVLRPGGILFLYGSFIRGEIDSRSREKLAQWGIWRLDDVTREAESQGLALVETVAMPASSLSLVFRTPLGA